MTNTTTFSFKPILLGFLLGIFLVVGYTVLAWNPPGAAPPAGNVAPPVHTGTSSQTKTGALQADGGLGTIGNIAAGGNITALGNVGIGTASPAAQLDINGTIYTEGGIGDVDGNGIVNILDWGAYAGYFTGSPMTRVQSARADVDGDGRVTYDDMSMMGAILGGISKDTASRAVHSSYGTFCDYMAWSGGNCTDATFTLMNQSSLSVSAGTSINSKVHILQTGTEDVLRIWDEASDPTPFVIDQNGNVGIGSFFPPAQKLSVDSGSNTYIASFVATGGSLGGFGILADGIKTTLRSYYGRDVSIETYDSDWVNRLYINAASGNVGIGTPSTNERLTVNGIMSLQEQAVSPAATANYGKLYVKTDNNSILKTTLAQRLNLEAEISPELPQGQVSPEEDFPEILL